MVDDNNEPLKQTKKKINLDYLHTTRTQCVKIEINKFVRARNTQFECPAIFIHAVFGIFLCFFLFFLFEIY